MAADKFTPIITSYKGTTFRSKSEAIFARALDLANEDNNDVNILWEYEPESYRYDDYVPDFLVVVKVPNESPQQWIVEYKPSEPSSAYLDRWEKRAKFYESIKQPIKLCAVLSYGSPYSKDYGNYELKNGDRIHDTESWVGELEWCAEKAKTFRFDLAA